VIRFVARLAMMLALVAALAACERQMANMYDQPKLQPLQPSPLWQDGRGSRPLPADTIPYSAGWIASTSSGRLQRVQPLPSSPITAAAGRTAAADTSPATGTAAAPGTTALGTAAREPTPAAAAADSASVPGVSTAATNPLSITQALLARGRERYNIYCSPCHGFAGHGDGMVAQRGFPHPPSYHIDRLRQAPDSYFFDVMTRGYGDMYSYADRVDPHDRWAIVAYIRALQLSQNASLNDVPQAERAKLDEASRDMPGGGVMRDLPGGEAMRDGRSRDAAANRRRGDTP
jgi:mono/diheme cytochrome c family protein